MKIYNVETLCQPTERFTLLGINEVTRVIVETDFEDWVMLFLPFHIAHPRVPTWHTLRTSTIDRAPTKRSESACYQLYPHKDVEIQLKISLI